MGFLEAIGILFLIILASILPRATVCGLVMFICYNSNMLHNPVSTGVEKFFVSGILFLGILGLIFDSFVISVYITSTKPPTNPKEDRGWLGGPL